MAIEEPELLDLIYGGVGALRYTQDSPVMASVWLHFWHHPNDPLDVLITPYAETTAAEVAESLRKRLSGERAAEHDVELAYTETYVVARLSLDELLWAALPLSYWWFESLCDRTPRTFDQLATPEDVEGSPLAPRGERGSGRPGPGTQLEWFVDLGGLIAYRATSDDSVAPPKLPPRPELVEALKRLFAGRDQAPSADDKLIWTINVNRPAHPAVSESRMTVKADAAERLFRLSASNLVWAVIDTGIDATHPAFARRRKDGSLPAPHAKNSRVKCTFDFTRLRGLQTPSLEPTRKGAQTGAGDEQELTTLQRALRSGRAVQWDLLKDELAIAHDDGYTVPPHEHGTHVAGVLGGDWRTTDENMPGLTNSVGICPDIDLYDLRALDEHGEGDEFAVLAALQFVRYLNAQHDRPVVHGVNISLSLLHDVRNYASGRTPVCEEAERLVASGVVVVAAAGNAGYEEFTYAGQRNEGYRSISITDPGNAEGVITVGATHRAKPHTYGVSYFSSRGPTGDGRLKPDLVAPGEKIEAAVPGPRLAVQDGTSMAAPHVSGAAALILARHRELIGQPARIKQILCESATDLGREHYFQGAGLVDVLRALQAV